MTPDSVVQIVREALMLAFWVAAPMLAIGFFVGIAVSLVQIATSMQDNAFSTVPRLIAFLIGILLLLPWMLQKTVSYSVALFGDLARSMPFCWCWRAWGEPWYSSLCRARAGHPSRRAPRWLWDLPWPSTAAGRW